MLKMKLALILLMSALVVSARQYFRDHPREMSWWSPYSSPSFIGKYQPNILYYFKSNPLALQNGNFNRDEMANTAEDTIRTINLNEDEQPAAAFPDSQSRVKGLSNLDRLSADSNEQQASGRFLLNLLSSTGTYTVNAFFKTATFTVSSSVSLTSFVNCVPSTQVLNGLAATACRRKRSEGSSDNSNMPLLMKSDEFPIAPSATLPLVPTVVLSSSDQFHQLSSSKNDDVNNDDDIISAFSDSRRKRFLFFNQNQFVVSTTVTSYSFSNTTLTITRNLLNPAPAAGVNCLAIAVAPVAPAVAVPQCIACLPAGYVVCPASG